MTERDHTTQGRTLGDLDNDVRDLETRIVILETTVQAQTTALNRLDEKLEVSTRRHDLKLDELRAQITSTSDGIRNALDSHLADEGAAAKRIVWSLLGIFLTSIVGFGGLLMKLVLTH